MKLFKLFVITVALVVGQLLFADSNLKLGNYYPTTPIDQRYFGEELPGSKQAAKKGVDHIVYLTSSADREAYRVVISAGIAYSLNGKAYKMTDSMVNYVMDPAGNFYFFQNEKLPQYRHSSIFAGQPVAAAGEVVLDQNGKIVKVNRSSGHYKPASMFLQNALNELKKSGVDLSKIQIDD